MTDSAGRPSPFADLVAKARPPESRSIPAMLDAAARKYSDKVLLKLGSRELSFVQCRDRAAGMAGGLAARGVKPGERVAIMCGNRIEIVDYLVGCLWLGAIAVPINTALRGAQLSHVLTLSAARVLVLDGELLGHVGSLPVIASLEEIWPLDATGVESASLSRYRRGKLPECSQHLLPVPTVKPGQPCAILFTSGTTGPSKGAICPAAQFYWWAEYQTAAMDVTSESVIYNALPLFHINALNSFTQGLLTGATCVIGERFSASRYWRDAAECGATHTALISAMADILLAQPEGAWDRAHKVRTVLGSSIRADIWPPFSERFGLPRRVGGYASTETNLVFNTDDGWAMPGNMGFVADGFEAAVVDEQDTSLPDGTAGELVLRSHVPFAFCLGYWGMPEATVASWKNLWFHTGDRVVRGLDGRFQFVGRLKESIRRRGENISAWEVEQALLEHDAIAQVAAYAISAELAGEEVMVAIVLKPGAAVAPKEITEFLEPRLARFAIPRYIEFVDSLPLTDTGKVRRSDLQQRGVTAATWDRQAAGDAASTKR